MLLFKNIAPLQSRLQKKRALGKKIGFAPTMGALHAGHASLVQMSKSQSDITVCSIFVNPAQFNDPEDLKKYPRTEDRDIELLKKQNTDILFYPTVDAIYPSNLQIPTFDFGQIDKVMEGKFRPGHFAGVAKVVYRLLDIVQPDFLFMGQKDFQQFTLIHHLIRQAKLSVKLVVCPTLREKDGLAMSSRNTRLTPENRAKSPVIYQTLLKLNTWLQQESIREVEKRAIDELSKVPDFRPEYLKIVDSNTLQPVEKISDTNYLVACIAVWAGNIRLIDNVILFNNEDLKI